MGIQGTIQDWRKDHLERLDELQDRGFIHVEWSAAGDEHVCTKCADRDGVVYTITGMRKVLRGIFCEPGDPDDRCRCVIVPAEVPAEGSSSFLGGKQPKQRTGCLVVVGMIMGLAALAGVTIV